MKKTEWNNYWDKKINEHFNVKPVERIDLREFVENVYNEKYGIVGEKKKDKGILTGLSGVQGEAIYEAMVYIVAKMEGENNLPTADDVNNVIEDTEMRTNAREWLKSKLKTDEQELLETIRLIGGDVKKIPNVPWGPNLVLISQSIDEYYDATPPEYGAPGRGKKVKANTADMVIVISGTKEDVLNTLRKKSVSKKTSKGGVISSNDGKTKWIQASIKKSKEGARVGKGSAIINDKFGQQAMMPASLVRSFGTNMSQDKVRDFQISFLEKVYANSPEIAQTSVEQLSSDFEAWFADDQNRKLALLAKDDESALTKLAKKFSKDKYGLSESEDISEGILSGIKSMVSKGIEYAKRFLTNIFKKNSQEIIDVGNSASSSAEKTDANIAAQKLTNLLDKGSSESSENEENLNEADIPINEGFMRDVKALSEEILAKNLVDKEFDNFLSQLSAIQKKLPGSVRLINPGNTLQKFEGDSMEEFKRAASEVLLFAEKEIKKSKKPILPEKLKRGLYNTLVKVTVNFATYQTFNQILNSVVSKGKNITEMRKALLDLSAEMIADAKFGNTSLPLWIVYGMGDGVYNLGTISDYKEKLKTSKQFEKMNYPYIVFSVTRSSTRSGDRLAYNAIYMYLMVDVTETEEGTFEPVYAVVQHINRQSSFSYKMDTMKTASASELKIEPNK